MSADKRMADLEAVLARAIVRLRVHAPGNGNGNEEWPLGYANDPEWDEDQMGPQEPGDSTRWCAHDQYVIADAYRLLGVIR